jgi:hypothetical protein
MNASAEVAGLREALLNYGAGQGAYLTLLAPSWAPPWQWCSPLFTGNFAPAALVWRWHWRRAPGWKYRLLWWRDADATGQQIVLSLRRVNAIRSVDAANYSLVAEAGCTLSAVQAGCRRAPVPLSLGSEGSCQIGGNLATTLVALQSCATE